MNPETTARLRSALMGSWRTSALSRTGHARAMQRAAQAAAHVFVHDGMEMVCSADRDPSPATEIIERTISDSWILANMSEGCTYGNAADQAVVQIASLFESGRIGLERMDAGAHPAQTGGGSKPAAAGSA